MKTNIVVLRLVSIDQNFDCFNCMTGNLFNWLSNRWGLMGQEDLGGGNSMYFKLEQGFNLSNGSEAVAGKAFNRETALGLSGDWGKLGFGRFGDSLRTAERSAS